MSVGKSFSQCFEEARQQVSQKSSSSGPRVCKVSREVPSLPKVSFSFDCVPIHHDLPHSWLRGGEQLRVMRKLKRSRLLPIEAVLDLHGLTACKAFEVLQHFILENSGAGYRKLLVICGKGLGSRDIAVNKMLTIYLLYHMQSVRAYCLALDRDGGQGAFYVLV